MGQIARGRLPRIQGPAGGKSRGAADISRMRQGHLQVRERPGDLGRVERLAELQADARCGEEPAHDRAPRFVAIDHHRVLAPDGLQCRDDMADARARHVGHLDHLDALARRHDVGDAKLFAALAELAHVHQRPLALDVGGRDQPDDGVVLVGHEQQVHPVRAHPLRGIVHRHRRRNRDRAHTAKVRHHLHRRVVEADLRERRQHRLLEGRSNHHVRCEGLVGAFHRSSPEGSFTVRLIFALHDRSFRSGHRRAAPGDGI